MKIGITLNDFYKSFLEETAALNGMTITKVCSLIVLNYLSFNKQKDRIPLFFPSTSVVYANKRKKEVVDDEGIEVPSQTRDEILSKFENDQYIDTDINDEELPF